MSSNRAPETIDAVDPPRRAGPYELLLEIASGGMATVFLARKRGAGDFQRTLALKLTHAHLRGQPGWAEELIEEAKLATRIRHPNVVQVLDVEDDPAGVFLVMEYVEGDTLSGLAKHAIRSGSPMPRDVAIRILIDALAGLHAAHELRDDQGRNAGLVHRDFTPQNILVGLDGVARLTDFGVAKAETRASFTTTGSIKGKTGYMAPEQVHGRPLDRRADIWAAGIVAWEIFAGRRMYPVGEDPIATLVKAATYAPARLSSVISDIPGAIDDAVAGALALDRERRFPTANAFREALLAACNDEIADPAIVGDYVQMVNGAALEARRADLATHAGAVVKRSDRPSALASDDASMMSSSVDEVRAPRVPTLLKAATFFFVGVAIASAVYAGSNAALRSQSSNVSDTSAASASAVATSSMPSASSMTSSTSAPSATIETVPASESPSTTPATSASAKSPHTPARTHRHSSPAASAPPSATTPADKPLAPTPYE